MDRTETVKILAILRGAYPQFYRDTDKQEALDTVNLWQSMFADDDFTIVSAAVKALISADEKGFPPVIGQVKARIRKITQPPQITDGEAWALVSKAIRNGYYSSKEEFDALPENIRRIVGSPQQLKDWSMMDSDTVHSVVASNFQRAYRVRTQNDAEYAALPPDVKKIMEQIAGGNVKEIEA